jgi:hypothetical protein
MIVVNDLHKTSAWESDSKVSLSAIQRLYSLYIERFLVGTNLKNGSADLLYAHVIDDE